ncbi:hypothetical protein GCM10025875_35740 [Litorihabitans aurantiacus]|uniref:Uncharacterized protein n=1 Tax=Litorihabitans aurantiacus TaxID=1930061 RepID=A0AA37UMU7_9MICO|nr:hypothetical protein GCM10025875_00750 [Litorihabitans aurantiacus]GMA33582.1 hypothetical protein GCM10025875_35740 [Litorihabitans aurantiacus]
MAEGPAVAGASAAPASSVVADEVGAVAIGCSLRSVAAVEPWTRPILRRAPDGIGPPSRMALSEPIIDPVLTQT